METTKTALNVATVPQEKHSTSPGDTLLPAGTTPYKEWELTKAAMRRGEIHLQTIADLGNIPLATAKEMAVLLRVSPKTICRWPENTLRPAFR
jgi:hypothetical protein